jgi:hypothetical protein
MIKVTLLRLIIEAEKFTAEQSLTLADIRRGMHQKRLSGMRQRDMRDMLAPV